MISGCSKSFLGLCACLVFFFWVGGGGAITGSVRQEPQSECFQSSS